ncbi:uncharacterized protein LOC126886197 [Diabrotica virgifera virgifera]|uniref:Uncharacterized protein n=1 Tax=Diabrotica virgifera virgifera TaxID=50390 RepID=A0ABM5KFT0_DIAVI|nr:uncharacterized protein LOC126886197 [Diabrotica virgifera virgifera]
MSDWDEIKNLITNLTSEMRKDLKEIKNDFQEYKKTLKIFREENIELKKEINELKMKVENLEKLEEKVENIEKYKKKNNIIISGFKIRDNEEEAQEEIEKFVENKLQVVIKAKKLTKINETMCVLKLNNREKADVMKNKHKLRHVKGQKIFIRHDLTEQENKIQKSLQEIAKDKRNQNKKVVIGYQKLIINGEKFIWNKKKNTIESTNTLHDNSKN